MLAGFDLQIDLDRNATILTNTVLFWFDYEECPLSLRTRTIVGHKIVRDSTQDIFDVGRCCCCIQCNTLFRCTASLLNCEFYWTIYEDTR